MSVPRLRFKEFRDDWLSSELDKIATTSSGGTPNRTKPEYWGGSIPWVSTSLIDFNVINNSDEFITEEGLKNSSAKLFPKDTLLMAMYGQGKTRGKVAILGLEASTNQACAAITFHQNTINIQFAFQNLAGRYDEIRDLSNAGGQENLSAGLIKQIQIAFPSLSEQTKIANFLTAIDEKITQLTQKYDLLKQYKKGVMQQIFSQKLRFKDDDGREFPEWKEKYFGDIFSFVNTNSLSRELLSHENGSVKNIHYGDIHTKYKSYFKIEEERVPYIKDTVDLSKTPSEHYCKVGDLVIADASEDYNDIGKAIEIINLNSERLLAGLHTYIARDVSNKIALGFSGYLMQAAYVRLQIKTLATGVSVLGISKTSLAKIKINIPSKPEQTKIANFLTAIDDKITQAQTQLDAVKQYKKGLLQQLFV